MKISKLYPAYKDYLWGGQKLKERYGKDTTLTPLAESWELSFHPDGPTALESGALLKDEVTTEDLGKKVTAFEKFPLLIKFIDAADNLSVQVHPSDDYALKNENSFGKTEMWYVVEADEGAGLYVGFDKKVDKESFLKAVKGGTFTELLRFYPVKAGECYFIPAGTVHAIGKGCLVCEIQQNSNLTYRIYDYCRKGKDGKERELHLDKALAVADLNEYKPPEFDGDVIGACKYFTARKKDIDGEESFVADKDSFVCVTCVGGEGCIEGQRISRGDSYFVPASYGEFKLIGKMQVVLTDVE